MTANIEVAKSVDREFFNPRSVAIVSSTLYKGWYSGNLRDITDTDKVRGDLALDSIRMALRRGYQIVVADEVSSPEFRAALTELGIDPLPRENPSRAYARRKTIAHASKLSGVKVIVRTELEKNSLIRDCVPSLALPILNGEADIVAGKRNPVLSDESYPRSMRLSELEANRRINKILKNRGLLAQDQDLDIFFGPTIHKNDPEINALFMETYAFDEQNRVGARIHVKPEEFSNAQFFPVIRALALGKKVVSIEVPFVYPTTQRRNEESEEQQEYNDKKRKEQRMGFITEIIHLVRLLSNDPKVKKKGLLKLTE